MLEASLFGILFLLLGMMLSSIYAFIQGYRDNELTLIRALICVTPTLVGIVIFINTLS